MTIYISPFWIGVAATLLFEFAVLVLLTIAIQREKKR